VVGLVVGREIGVSAVIDEAEKKFCRVQRSREVEKLVTALKAIDQKQKAEAQRVA